MQLCAVEIPKALEIKKQCQVDRAHRLGNPQAERRGHRQVIAKYLNYTDKTTILQTFRTQRQLAIDNTDLLIFADYAAELTKRMKLFSKACTILFQKQIKFTLAYPATLHLQTPEGAQRSIQDPTEAELYAE